MNVKHAQLLRFRLGLNRGFRPVLNTFKTNNFNIFENPEQISFLSERNIRDCIKSNDVDMDSFVMWPKVILRFLQVVKNSVNRFMKLFTFLHNIQALSQGGGVQGVWMKIIKLVA